MGPATDGVRLPTAHFLKPLSSPASRPLPRSSSPRTVCVALPHPGDVTQPLARPRGSSSVLGTACQGQTRGLDWAVSQHSRGGLQTGAERQLLSSKPKTALRESSSGTAPGQPLKNGF